MAVSQADIDALNSAIATGVRSVTINGQTTIYNTTESLIKARDDMQRQLAAQLAAANGAAPRRITYLNYGGRGY
jgi:hypothetical protein